jgi:lysylphosphatidylglycerol synthetase-like protein (DUF2156 family)
MAEPAQSDLAAAVQEVTERTSVLIREEIELAKAEISTKISRLAKGAAIGAAAGVFVIGALIYLLHGLAWLLWAVLPVGQSDVWIGYAIVGVLLVLLAILAAFIAYRLVKRGSPPMPQMAIEEAQLIRQTVTEAQHAPLERTTT